jgi:ABC-type transport system involved in multi-copper enzyme maturation permease subunit
MLKHLIIKEIMEIITNTRSLFVLLICVLLIPLGLYVSTKEYEQARTAYKDAERMYEEQSKDSKSLNFVVEGYIPPSPLCIFSSGLSGYLPDKISADSRGTWYAENEYGINNPIALLFGKIDFYFIVTIILSLLAFMFTFNSVTGEKESGTLRLVAANAVPRWKIILAKITGNYLVFLVTFLVGVISGLVLLTLTSSIPILSSIYMVPFMVILVISLMFLFVLFNLGILLSIKTRNSGASITASLLLWILMAIVIPKISPMIAQVVYPIETEEVVNKQKTMKRNEIQEDLNKAKSDLMAEIMGKNGLNPATFEIWSNTAWDNPSFRVSRNDYDLQIGDVIKKYDERTEEVIGKIERDFNTQKQIQQNISKNISRISPVCCYTYLISDFSHTGLGELKNIESNANQFRHLAESEYYNPLRKDYKEYHVGGSITSGYFGQIDQKNIKVPVMENFKYPSLSDSLFTNWIDLLLICFYTLLFFAVSVFQFIKYDVR